MEERNQDVLHEESVRREELRRRQRERREHDEGMDAAYAIVARRKRWDD